jgi:hypothetical protein
MPAKQVDRDSVQPGSILSPSTTRLHWPRGLERFPLGVVR